MIKRQRKYHFIIWKIWAVCLPIGLICAIAWRPSVQATHRMVENPIIADFIALSDSSGLLRISLAELASPTCLVMYINNRNEEILLGKIEHAGSHSFVVPDASPEIKVTLYDGIHEQTLSTLVLQRKP